MRCIYYYYIIIDFCYVHIRYIRDSVTSRITIIHDVLVIEMTVVEEISYGGP